MEEQIRYVFETNNIGVKDGNLNVDDVIETANHFRLVSLIIDNAKSVLTEEFIEGLHLLLKSGASDSRRRAAMNISKKIWILLLVFAAGVIVGIYLRYFRKEYKEYTFKSDARDFTIKLKYNTDFTLEEDQGWEGGPDREYSPTVGVRLYYKNDNNVISIYRSIPELFFPEDVTDIEEIRANNGMKLRIGKLDTGNKISYQFIYYDNSEPPMDGGDIIFNDEIAYEKYKDDIYSMLKSVEFN